MTWCEHLTHRPTLPAWNGPAHLHKLFSGDDPPPRDHLDNGEPRLCPACQRHYPATRENFYVRVVRTASGVYEYLRTKCKDCDRAEQSERSRRKDTK